MTFVKGQSLRFASVDRAMLQMEFEKVISNRPILMSGNIQPPHTPPQPRQRCLMDSERVSLALLWQSDLHGIGHLSPQESLKNCISSKSK